MRTSLRIQRGLRLCILSLFIALTSSAQLYVNDASTTGDVFTTGIGSDANSGTASAPFATIAKAYSVATPGTVIYVDAGSYVQPKIVLNKAVRLYGSNYNVSAVTGVRNAESVIDFSSNSNGANFLVNSTGTVEIKGFRIEDNAVTTGQRHAVELVSSNAHIVANNIFSRITTIASGAGAEPRAVYINPVAANTSVTIDNNLFTGTSSGLFGNQSWRRAIWKQAGTGTTNITNNKFENCRSHINNDEQLVNTNISGNIFDLGNTGTSAISVGGSALNGSFVLGANEFKGLGTLINCSGVGTNFQLNITSSSYNGKAFSAMTNAELFTIESYILHGLNSGRTGLVRVKAANLFVIPSSNNPLNNPAKGNIQSAINLGTAGDVINIQNGTYEADLLLNKGVTLNGESAGGTVVKGTYSGSNNGSAACLFITASNAKVQHLTVTRNFGSNLNEWWACTKNQGITIAQTTGVVLDDVEVRDQRNGIYTPNATNFTVKNSFVHHNRTGFHLGVNNNGGKIINNIIHDNFTHGLLINFSFNPNNINDLQVTNNSFERNWYSHINLNSGTDFTAGTQNFNCNWFGTSSVSSNATNTSEPGYTLQTPTQFGGTDPNAFNGAIRGGNAALVNYIPFLGVGTDASNAAGFQPAANACGLPISNLRLTGKTDVLCFGVSTGAASLAFDNGFAPVQYSLNGSSFVTITGQTIQLQNLAAGNYTLLIKDASGTQLSQNFVITQPAAPVIASITVSKQDQTFTGANTANTLFLGYGAQQLQLSATANYNVTFGWSGNYLSSATGTNVSFAPSAAGMQAITVTATDVNGCTGNATVTLQVIDVRCGNKNDKVVVCQPAGKSGNAQSICISPNAVPAHLSKGSSLGACAVNNQRVSNAAVSKPSALTEPAEAFVRISPSLNKGSFTAELHNYPQGRTTMRIVDQQGKIVETRNAVIANATEYIRFNLNAVNGIYYLQTELYGKPITNKIIIQR